MLDAPCSRVGHIFRHGGRKRPAAKNAGDFISVVSACIPFYNKCYTQTHIFKKTNPWSEIKPRIRIAGVPTEYLFSL